jgi:hypothetical protein
MSPKVPSQTHTVYRIRQVCHACNRLHTASSRHGIWFRCQWCRALNAGPRLIAEYGMTAPPARGRRAPGVSRAPKPAPVAQTAFQLLGGRR